MLLAKATVGEERKWVAALLLLCASYQRHLARQQQVCLIMQGFDIIHHVYHKAAVQTLQGSNSCAN